MRFHTSHDKLIFCLFLFFLKKLKNHSKLSSNEQLFHPHVWPLSILNAQIHNRVGSKASISSSEHTVGQKPELKSKDSLFYDKVP